MASGSSGTFITCMLVLILFNFMYLQINPDGTNVMVFGTITGTIVTALGIGIIAGFNFLGSGLTGESVRIVFGIAVMLNILFQINIAGYPVGTGLVNNVVSLFPPNEMFGIGFWVASLLAMTTLITGLMVIVE